ncbi:MAG TPA: hypothetical protein PLM32_13130 [Candidatus Competibacter sp.]|nr:hypothetical protein [Candidatus Competibacter sp.]
MTDKPYPDPPRPTIDDLDPESATTDRLTAMVHSNREGQEKLTRAKELATRYAALRKHP